ncbi:MAG: hypothetical protein KA105_05495 [Caulobacter sp.]|nr:hypothetical protein [Caulobacter sp.]
MSTLLTINVQNNSPMTEMFYFFQQPAVFTGGGMAYSNCLMAEALGSYSQTGAVLTFQATAQPYACIQQAHTTPQIGQMSGYATATRPIDLATGSAANDATVASVNPLGLSQPSPQAGVQPGAFRITTPAYAPPATYNIGSAVQVGWGPMLSSFVTANPNYNVDCQPVLKFYVQTGNASPGSVINFSQASVNAALCDFTSGYSVINVTLNPDGTWTVQMVQ